MPPVDLLKSPFIPAALRQLESSPVENPLTLRAASLKAEGRGAEADLVYRLAFTRGERNAKIDGAVDKATADVLRRFGKADVQIYRDHDEGYKRYSLTTIVSARRYLEGSFTSRVTLMDALELVDFSEPLIRLAGFTLNLCRSEDNNLLVLTIRGVYDTPDLSETRLSFSTTLEIDEGRLSVKKASIDVGEHNKRHGLGMRMLLRLAQFARLHGIERWEDQIDDDGFFVWPRLGVTVTDETYLAIRKKLGRLVEMGVVDSLPDFHDDLCSIAKISIPQSELRNEIALRAWCRQWARMSQWKIDEIKPPYAVGMMALRYSAVYADFVPDKICRELLAHSFPRRLQSLAVAKDGESPEESRMRESALDGIRRDFEQALLRERTFSAIADDVAESGIKVYDAATPECVVPQPEEVNQVGGLALPANLSGMPV